MLLRFIASRLFSADTGAGGTATPPPTGSDPGSSNAGGGDPGQAPAPASTSGDTSKADKTYTQADLDRMIKERLAEQTRRNEQKLAADKKAAEEKALADNAEWKTLADQRGAELETVKAQAALTDAYAKRLNALVDSEIASWPEEVKSLDPGPKALDARLDWLEKSRALAKRLAALPTAPATEAGAGNGATPPTTPPATPQGQGQRFRFTNENDVKW